MDAIPLRRHSDAGSDGRPGVAFGECLSFYPTANRHG